MSLSSGRGSSKKGSVFQKLLRGSTDKTESERSSGKSKNADTRKSWVGRSGGSGDRSGSLKSAGSFIGNVDEKPVRVGYVKKKSPKKAGLVSVWQTRYLCLYRKRAVLEYYKTHKQIDCLGSIPLDRVDSVLPKLRKECRFDVDMEGGRSFAFRTETKEDVQMWIEDIANIKKGKVRRFNSQDQAIQYWKPNRLTSSDFIDNFFATPFSEQLRPQELRAFGSYFSQNIYESGERLFVQQHAVNASQGDSGVFWLILQGEVEVYCPRDVAGQLTPAQELLCTKGPTDCLGQSTTFEGKRYMTAKCKSDVKTLMLTFDGLREFLRYYPEAEDSVYLLMGYNAPTRLKCIELFSDMSDEVLVKMSTITKYVALSQEDVLFHENDAGDAMYVVVRGSVETRGHPNSAEHDFTVTLGTFVNGDVLGEISTILEVPRTSSAVCSSTCLLLELKKNDFGVFKALLSSDENRQLDMEMKKHVAEHFRKYKVPFFESIPTTKYAKLAALCKITKYKEDHTIFSEGDEGTEFYIIVHGYVRVTKLVTENGKTFKKELCTLERGKYFGEIALIAEDPLRTATVQTMGKAIILSISKTNFEVFFDEAPEAMADFAVKLGEQGIQFRSVLFHPRGLEFFVKHCQNEYSTENIEFWRSCRDFKMSVNEEFETDYDEKMLTITVEDEEEDNTSTVEVEFATYTETLPVFFRLVYSAGRVTYHREALNDENHMNQVLECQAEQKKRDSHRGSVVSMLSTHKPGMSSFDMSSPPMPTASQRESETQIDLDDANSISHMSRDHMLKGLNVAVKAKLTVDEIRATFPQETSLEDFIRVMTNLENDVSKRIKHRMDIEIANMLPLFNYYDQDGSGFIEFHEFNSVLKEYNSHYSRDQLREKFKSLALLTRQDAKKNGELESSDEEEEEEQFDWTTACVGFNHVLHLFVLERVRKVEYQSQRLTMATHIWKQYIADGSDNQVNISHDQREVIENDVDRKHIRPTMFNTAQDEVFKLMNRDSYKRFKTGPLFKEFLKTVGSYKAVEKDVKAKKPGAIRRTQSVGGVPETSTKTRDSILPFPISPSLRKVGSTPELFPDRASIDEEELRRSIVDDGPVTTKRRNSRAAPPPPPGGD